MKKAQFLLDGILGTNLSGSERKIPDQIPFAFKWYKTIKINILANPSGLPIDTTLDRSIRSSMK
jgi:NAD(P)H-hydrate repair Nnr-like enzyme with NAD(P)H-hydrate epimerase domain